MLVWLHGIDCIEMLYTNNFKTVAFVLHFKFFFLVCWCFVFVWVFFFASNINRNNNKHEKIYIQKQLEYNQMLFRLVGAKKNFRLKQFDIATPFWTTTTTKWIVNDRKYGNVTFNLKNACTEWLTFRFLNANNQFSNNQFYNMIFLSHLFFCQDQKLNEFIFILNGTKNSMYCNVFLSFVNLSI